MSRKDFSLIAQIIAQIDDPWARNQAIANACKQLSRFYPSFDADKFREYVAAIEEDTRPENSD